MSMLEHLDDLRRAYDGLDGLALLRALLKEGPLAGRTALGLVVRGGERGAPRHGRDRRPRDPGDLPRHRQAVRGDPGVSRGDDPAAAPERRARGPAARGGARAPRRRRRPLAARARPLLPHPQDRAAAGRARGLRGLDHRAQALPGRAAQPAADDRAGVVERADQAQPAGAAGRPRTSSATFCCATCRSIRWSTGATDRSAASPAPAR